jgi:hypothetical protein
MNKHPRGLDGRSRDENGEIRRKNGSTLVGTLRQTYGPDFLSGVRNDAKLENVLKKTGKDSLNDLRRNS